MLLQIRGIVAKGLGHFLITSSTTSSRFFNKTNLEQYLLERLSLSHILHNKIESNLLALFYPPRLSSYVLLLNGDWGCSTKLRKSYHKANKS